MINFLAEVVDVKNDETRSGKVKIRLIGDQDDKSAIPDDKLRWATPVMPVTNPIHSKVGSAPTGLMKGSKVYGFFMDQDRQIPYILGSVGSAGKFGSLTDSPQMPRDIPVAIANSLPNAASSWATGDRRLEISANGQIRIGSLSLPSFAELQAGTGLAQFAKIPTIGTAIPVGLNAIDFIKKIDANNVAGVLGPQILSLLKNFQQSPNGKLIQMLGGASKLNSVLQFILQLIQQNNNNTQQVQRDKQEIIDKIQQIINNIKSIAANQYFANIEKIQDFVSELNAISYYGVKIQQILSLSDGLSQVSQDNIIIAVEQIISELMSLKMEVTMSEVVQVANTTVETSNTTIIVVTDPPGTNDTYYYP